MTPEEKAQEYFKPLLGRTTFRDQSRIVEAYVAGFKECKSDAQLIAHAPEMLEMLQKLLDLCEHVELRGQTITEANNLIKQATTI